MQPSSALRERRAAGEERHVAVPVPAAGGDVVPGGLASPGVAGVGVVIAAAIPAGVKRVGHLVVADDVQAIFWNSKFVGDESRQRRGRSIERVGKDLLREALV